MRLSYPLGDCEPEAGSAVCSRSGFIDPVESIENTFRMARGNAYSSVGHDNLHPILFTFNPD
jgi:hypothetical protein